VLVTLLHFHTFFLPQGSVGILPYAECFVSVLYRFTGNIHYLRSVACSYCQFWAYLSSCHDGCTIVCKHVVEIVIRAFRQFQSATGTPQKIGPQLSITPHDFNESFWRGLRVCAKFVDLSRRVVYETHHVEGDGNFAIWCLEGGSVSPLLLAVE
jgi:hypothetical protein